ncbi:MAG: hypothetical protein JJE50_15645 [Actinomycetales bacterium]|nr:hypothetical protein [Actinomycetales bacterium]
MTSNGTTRFGRSIAAAALTAIVLLLASPATTVSGTTFGDRVAQRARTTGFSGTHNPGMHQGAHNWNGMTCNP